MRTGSGVVVGAVLDSRDVGVLVGVNHPRLTLTWTCDYDDYYYSPHCSHCYYYYCY